ncbi:MAG: 4Fe-4S binding protein, partial [Bacillota bacterium]
EECPTEAISEGDIYAIDPEKCIDCGTCNEVCPVGAPNPA